MARLPISSITSTGREDRIDQNFTELYTVTDAAQAAWTTYVPTVSALTGTITTATATGAYIIVGKTVHVSISIHITTNGTGADNVRATLPATANITNQGYHLSGFVQNTAKAIIGQIGPAGDNTRVQCAHYDATYPGTDGNLIVVTGTYQSQ